METAKDFAYRTKLYAIKVLPLLPIILPIPFKGFLYDEALSEHCFCIGLC